MRPVSTSRPDPFNTTSRTTLTSASRGAAAADDRADGFGSLLDMLSVSGAPDSGSAIPTTDKESDATPHTTRRPLSTSDMSSADAAVVLGVGMPTPPLLTAAVSPDTDTDPSDPETTTGVDSGNIVPGLPPGDVALAPMPVGGGKQKPSAEAMLAKEARVTLALRENAGAVTTIPVSSEGNPPSAQVGVPAAKSATLATIGTSTPPVETDQVIRSDGTSPNAFLPTNDQVRSNPAVAASPEKRISPGSVAPNDGDLTPFVSRTVVDAPSVDSVRGSADAASAVTRNPHVGTDRENPSASVQPLHLANMQAASPTADVGPPAPQASVPRHVTETMLVPGVSDTPAAADVSGSEPASDGDGLAAVEPGEAEGRQPASQPEPGSVRNLTAPPDTNEISAYIAARSVDAVRAPNASSDPAALTTSPVIPTHGIASPVASRENYLGMGNDVSAAPGSQQATGGPIALTTSDGAQQIGEQIIRLAASTQREVTLRLSPPDLGELTIRLSVKGREVSAWFGSPLLPVQQAVSQMIGQLDNGLENAGYQLTGAWVGADASGGSQQDRGSAPPLPQLSTPRFIAASTEPLSRALSVPTGVSIYV